jgi:hypothetical protein
VGGGAIGAGALLLLWPTLTASRPPPVTVDVTPDGVALGLRTAF